MSLVSVGRLARSVIGMKDFTCGVQLLLAVAGVLTSARIPAVPSEVLLLWFSHQLLAITMGNTEGLG